jgi:hypothetical protein
MAEPTTDQTAAAARPDIVLETSRLGVSLPASPVLVKVEGDLADEETFRRFMARTAATQTISLQRTEWYARSVRMYVAIWFWVTLIGAIIAIILMIVLVNHTAAPTSVDPFNP